MSGGRKAGYLAAVFVLAISVVGMPNYAFAQQIDRFTISVDKESYSAAETVQVTGRVPALLEGVPVAIQVFNPRNVMYGIDQVMPEADRTYSAEVNIGGKLGISGTYVVRASYAAQSVQTTFQFTAGPQRGLMIDGFEILAALSNGNIERISVNQEFTSLILQIRTSTERDGMLEITLPREVIDAKQNGRDSLFVVLVDREEAAYEETMTDPTSRTLSIPVHAAAAEVEIIGTTVIPEFGIIAILVLAVSLAAVLVASRKNLLASLTINR